MTERMMPSYLTKAQLLSILTDMISLVAEDDSFEGSINYEFPWDEKMGDPATDPEGPGFRVRASYRTGNSMGQGGMRMVGEMVEIPDNV